MPWSVPCRLLRPAALALATAGCLAAAPPAHAATAPGVVVRFAPGTTAAQRAGAARAARTTAPRHIVGATWLVHAHGTSARAAIAPPARRARALPANRDDP